MYYMESGNTKLNLTQEKINENLYRRRMGGDYGLNSEQLNEFKSIKMIS